MNLRGEKATRGVPLIVVLVVLALFEAFTLVVNFLLWQQRVTHGQEQPELPAIDATIAVVALVALVGVFVWRRIAVYLLAAALACAVIFDSVVGLSALALLIRLVLIGAVAWCIKQKWVQFR